MENITTMNIINISPQFPTPFCYARSPLSPYPQSTNEVFCVTINLFVFFLIRLFLAIRSRNHLTLLWGYRDIKPALHQPAEGRTQTNTRKKMLKVKGYLCLHYTKREKVFIHYFKVMLVNCNSRTIGNSNNNVWKIPGQEKRKLLHLGFKVKFYGSLQMTFKYYDPPPISTEGQDAFYQPGVKSQLQRGDGGGREIISS